MTTRPATSPPNSVTRPPAPGSAGGIVRSNLNLLGPSSHFCLTLVTLCWPPTASTHAADAIKAKPTQPIPIAFPSPAAPTPIAPPSTAPDPAPPASTSSLEATNPTFVAAPLSSTEEIVVTGQVTNRDGEPLPGAIIEWGTRKHAFRYRKHAVANAAGRYQLRLRTADLKRDRHDDPKGLLATAPGHTPSIPSVPTDSTLENPVPHAELAPGVQTRDFILTPFGSADHTISGTVVDKAGRPIADARVEAFTPVVGFHSSFSMPTGRDYFPGPDRVTRTDAAGRFFIVDLPESEVLLNVRSPHRHVNDKNYPIAEDAKITMSDSGVPGQLQGRIIDATTGQPPANVERVRIVRRYSTTAHECCDEQGYFRLPSTATRGNGNLIYVYAPDYAATEVRLAAVAINSDKFVDVRLQPQPSLRGRLVDAESGLPLPNVRLMYGCSGKSRFSRPYICWNELERFADGHHSLGFVQHVVTDDDGAFWLAEPSSIVLGKSPINFTSLSSLLPSQPVPPLAPVDEIPAVCGTASNAAIDFTTPGVIAIDHDGYQRLLVEPELRKLDPQTGELIIRLPRESTLTGVVVKDGKPLAGVSVSIWPHAAAKQRDQMFDSVKTDAAGRFAVGKLGPGRHTIHAGPYSRVATLGPSQVATLNFGNDVGPLRIEGTTDANCSITFSPDFEWDYVRLETKSDDRGHYELTGLRPGKYRVDLSYVGHGYLDDRSNIPVEVTHDNQRCDFFLRPERKAAATASH